MHAKRWHCKEPFPIPFCSKEWRVAVSPFIICLPNIPCPKPGHTTGGSRRGAWQGGGAGSGRTVSQQNCPPRGQSFLVPPKAWKTRRLNDYPKARTREILFKPTCRIQNPDIPRADRVGEPGGAAGRGRARLGANRTVRLGNKGSSYFQKHRRYVASTSLEKHEQAKFHLNRRRNQTSG